MASLSYNEQRFTKVDKWTEDYSYKGILIAGKLNQKNGQDYKLVDAIDIDWDGAWLNSLHSYVYTTDDLLSAIDTINQNTTVIELNEDVAYIKELLNTMTASYVTTSYLGDVLTSYQNKLIPGHNIRIDADNTISGYGFVEHDELYEFSTSYATVTSLNTLEQTLYRDFYIKTTVDELIETAADEAVRRVVDGADEAFDTLKEIAEWINGQNKYVPIDYADMVKDGSKEYYILNEETQEYIKVSLDFILENPDVQYYEMRNAETDIADIFNQITSLDNRVGRKIDNGDNSYTYTGIMLDIYNLQEKDRVIQQNFDTLTMTVLDAEDTANNAYSFAYGAYNFAEYAYDLASYSLTITGAGIEEAHLAYEIAVKASEDVGTPSQPGGYREITEEELAAILAGESEQKAYIYNDINGTYVEVETPDNESLQYFVFDEPVEATGITKRMEDIEAADAAQNIRMDGIETKADSALYNLEVNNLSSYVSLSLSPSTFDGFPERTLSIESVDGIFNEETGLIEQDGLVSMNTAKSIYSYMSSWLILPNSNEETDPENTDGD